MRTYAEAFAAARDEPPFSNGTEGYGWMENWCWQCHHPVEKAWQEYEAGEREAEDWFQGGCPLILVAMMGRTPSEWLPQGNYFGDQFHCIEFRGPDDGDGDPVPQPDPPGMDGLFERPAPATRMLVQREQVLV